MTPEAQAENEEALARGLEPPHCDVFVCDYAGKHFLTAHTDAQRLSALHRARKR